MVIDITQTDDAMVWINGKLATRDTNGNWTVNKELSPSEETALHQYLTSKNLL